MPDREKILNTAARLADEIKNGETYNNYTESLAKVKSQPALYLRLQAYKDAAAKSAHGGSPVSFDEEKAIGHQYAELVNEPDAAAFLANENAFLQIYTGILNIIDGACEMETF